jgi:dihydroorotate dehydrogenase
LRALQERERLDALLAALVGRLRERGTAAGRADAQPLLVKVAPDLDDAALDEVVAVCLDRGASGLIAVNTTLSRDGLRSPVPLRDKAGGLSGRPLFGRALEVVQRLHRCTTGRLPIIGCGGVTTVDDAWRMLDAGAALVQLYTAFIYEGPSIARRLAGGLAARNDNG